MRARRILPSTPPGLSTLSIATDNKLCQNCIDGVKSVILLIPRQTRPSAPADIERTTHLAVYVSSDSPASVWLRNDWRVTLCTRNLRRQDRDSGERVKPPVRSRSARFWSGPRQAHLVDCRSRSLSTPLDPRMTYDTSLPPNLSPASARARFRRRPEPALRGMRASLARRAPANPRGRRRPA